MNIQKGFALGLALGFAFGLGCATAATVIPPAHAQSSAERWEYLMTTHGMEEANAAGAEGWELIQVNNQVLYFRRRL